MKNQLAFIGLAIILTIAFSCKDKNNKSAISPDYSATGNPYPNNQTVTGSTTYTSPATKSSSFLVGDIGWSNPSCLSTASLSLRGVKDNVDVVLTFASPISAGTKTYQISTQPSANACALTVNNAPEQPAGVFWYGKTGTVVVSTTSTSINANLIGVVCTQKEFNFPQVIVTGALGCAGQ